MVRDQDLRPIERLSMPCSELARKAGCTCDPEKNNHGRGYRYRDGWGYEIASDCPLEFHQRIGACELAE